MTPGDDELTDVTGAFHTAAVRLRLAQDVARLGMWDWDLHSGELTWDEQCAALFGITLEQFGRVIEAFQARTHPEDLPRVMQVLDRVRAEGGSFELGYRALWPDGSVRYLLARGQSLADEQGQVVRLLGAVLDVTELRAAADARARLASVALRLAEAETLEQVNRAVLEQGFPALGAAGGGLFLRGEQDGEPVLRVTLSAFYDPQVGPSTSVVPLDFDAPAAHVARTGEPLYFRDLDTMLERFPDQVALLRQGQVQAAASLPLSAGGRLLGSLTATWSQPRSFEPGEIELVEALAAQCAAALDRVTARERELRATAAARSMSEALQRSLLTEPPEPDHLQIAVRYLPALELVQVGGDWYDAFLVPDGATNLVVGDVTGHDRDAAARMGAVRNLLRATAYAVEASPAAVLAALEQAMLGLGVDTMATAVLARVEQTAEQAERGMRTLRWSNAGHLPPLLRRADGSCQVLRTEADLLLGLLPDATRTDHAIELGPDDTVLLYTDGLTERRGEDLDVGVSRLRDALAELGHLPLQELCDALLQRLLGGQAEDDVALLALRCHDQSCPRPLQAGPERLPTAPLDPPVLPDQR